MTLDHLGRQFTRGDFAAYDLVLAVDVPVARALTTLAPPEHRDRVRLARSFDPAAPPDAEVPDPYYGDQAAFDQVFDVCLAACRGILAAFPPVTSSG